MLFPFNSVPLIATRGALSTIYWRDGKRKKRIANPRLRETTAKDNVFKILVFAVTTQPVVWIRYYQIHCQLCAWHHRVNASIISYRNMFSKNRKHTTDRFSIIHSEMVWIMQISSEMFRDSVAHVFPRNLITNPCRVLFLLTDHLLW